MSLYENEICPVCKKEFCDGDDIVVCPECGTPHHRDCYNLAGKCVNTGLHKAGYDYRSEQRKNENILHAVSDRQTADTTQQENAAIPIIGGTPNEQDNEEKRGEPLNPVNIFRFTQTDNSDEIYEKDTQTIDGESTADFAAAIKINIPRFINKFKDMEYKNKKASWNWCALFFGPVYLFARKMYKQGLAFICLSLSLLFAGNGLIFKFAPEYAQAVQSLAQTAQKTRSVNPEDILALNSIGDAKTAAIIAYVCLAVFIVLRIVQAVWADYFYKKTVSAIVKRINNDFDEITFMPNPMMGIDENMSKAQLKKMLLAQKGGVSYFIPAMLLWLIVMILI